MTARHRRICLTGHLVYFLRGSVSDPAHPHELCEGHHCKVGSEPVSEKHFPAAKFSRMVRKSGVVPVFSAAAHLGACVTNSHAAAFALSALARYGQCGLRRLREAIDLLPVVPIFSEHSHGRLPDVLPLHPRLVKSWVKWRGKDSFVSQENAVGSLVKGLAEALNLLYCAGFSDRYILPVSVRPLSRRQEGMLEYLWQAAAEFLDVPSVPFSFEEQRTELATRRLSYAGEVVSVSASILAELVEPIWPAVGEAAVCCIADLIDPHLATELRDPKGCLRPVEDWPKKTPRSRVFATDQQWFATVRAAADRGIMKPVAENKIFRNQFGEMVLNGAMAVEKVKNGKAFQRFISCFGPINFYTRDLGGDADTLPQASFLSRIILSEGEELCIDGEDLQSSFNLFTIPEQWHGFFAYNKKVPWSVLGFPGGGDTYVCSAVVPMGWSASVGLIQNLLRRLVYTAGLISPECELRVGQPFPLEQVAVTCIDGFDVVSREPPEHARDSGGRLFSLAAFASVCAQLGLPLNAGKQVVQAYNASLLGGELDGRTGVLRHERAKSHKLMNKTLALLSFPAVAQAPLQHWAGVYAFAAGFRRPLFSVLQELFTCISSFVDPLHEQQVLSPEVVDEILCGVLLLPLARVNLRAPLRASLSISDASERGGSAAEADSFVPSLSRFYGEQMSANMSSLNEQRARLKDAPTRFYCGICTAECSGAAKCGPGCDLIVCSLKCYGAHRGRTCSRLLGARPSVGLVFVGNKTIHDLASAKQDPGWGWALLNRGIDVEMVSVESRSLSIPSILICDFLLVDAGNTNFARLAPPVRRLILRLVGSLSKFLSFILASERKFLFLHPHVSTLWGCPAWTDFLGTTGVSVEQAGLQGEVWAVHNFKCSVDVSITGVSATGVSKAFVCECVVRFVVPELAKIRLGTFPLAHADRTNWVFQQLISSTRGLSHDINSINATSQVMKWLDSMVPGREAEHLHALYRSVDLRGSDVRLDTGAVLMAARQSMPYPAFAWDWTPVQSYSWAVPQHINVLELVAFFNYLRGVICRNDFKGVRFFHVLDSMVASSVVGKGRSSSRLLNRTLRRTASLLLVGDLYPVALWTISGWNYSDSGSRYVRSRIPPDAASA